MSIEGAEAAQILDQLAKIQVQLTEKVRLSTVTDDLADLRSEIAGEHTNINNLINRMINAQATLNDLEQRVRDLETGV
jgi:septal ring factor EnvC (AmiA/AmiB activator)